MANKPLELLKFNGDDNNYPIRTLQVVYGICRTAAATAAKQVDVDINTTTGYQTNFQLEKGATVYVYFEQTNSANNPTLQIYNYNASTQTRTAITGQTAASIYYNGAAVSKAYLQTKKVIQFIYDGNYFQLVGWVDTNSDTKVSQNPLATNEDLPVIIKAASATTATTTTVGFDTDSFTYNPSSNTLKVANAVMTSADVAALVAKNGGVTYFELKTPTASTNGVVVANAPVADTDVANKQYVDQAFAANDAMLFKGTIGAAAQSPTVTSLPAEHQAGWTYRVVTAGTYAGYNCEIGDLIICVTDGTAANNAHWTVVQYNVEKPAYLDGNTVINENIPLFDSTGGKLKDSGYYVNTTQKTVNSVSNWTAGSALQFGDDIPADDITAWNAGTLPTKGTQVTATKITSWDAGELTTWSNDTADDITSWSAGTTPTLNYSSASVSKLKTAGSTPTASSVTADDITAWDAGTKPTLTYSSASVSKLKTAGSAPTAASVTADDITAWSAGEKPTLTYSSASVSKVKTAGSTPTAATVTADDITSWSAGTVASLTSSSVTASHVTNAGTPPTRSAMTASKITAWNSGDSSKGSQSAVYSAGIMTFTLESSPLVGITKPSLTYSGVDFYSITDVGAMPTFEDIVATKITAWSAGTAPTLEYTARTFSAITGLGAMPTFDSVTVDHITSWDAGTEPSISYTEKTFSAITGLGSMPTFDSVTVDHITSWSAGTEPSISYTEKTFSAITGLGSMPTFDAVTVDHITSWSAGTAPTLSYSEKTLSKITSAGKLPTLTSSNTSFYPIDSVGTLPSLSYTAKTIPNVVSANVPGALTTAAVAFYALAKR